VDGDTNFLYLADTLPKKYPLFYERFESLLKDQNITYGPLPNTKDVWAVDYMPVQVSGKGFVQFTYNPDYLRNSIKWRKTITDVDQICRSLNIKPHKSNIILDGGNLVRAPGKAIMCDKIFSENPSIPAKDLIRELKDLLEIGTLIIIPTDENDFTGHADGMARFFDEGTVLVNDYSQEDKRFQARFERSLVDAGLNLVRVSYNPYGNKSYDSAKGTYLNFLQMNRTIVLPAFEIEEDQIALELFQKLYGKETVLAIDSNDVAQQGGILNCISWNIKT
jgi:agmatine deiminase